MVHLVLLTGITCWAATPIEVPIDPATSTMNSQLCLHEPSENCDTDSTPVAGYVLIDFLPRSNPTTIKLVDFQLPAQQVLNFQISYGYFGDLLASATNVSIVHANPGLDNPEVAIVNGQFALTDVPYRTHGIMHVNATGAVCAVFESLGLACQDDWSLSIWPVHLLDPIHGTITVGDHVVTTSAVVSFSEPVHPTHTELATFSGVAEVNGTAPIPQVGDFDHDLDVDMVDFAHLQACMSGSGIPQTQQDCQDAQLDDDSDVDEADVSIFERCSSAPALSASPDCYLP